MADAPDRSEPAWALLLLGWMAWQAARRWSAPAPEPPPPARAAPALELASPRELRALPGIGEVRALAIARERWRVRSTGEPLDLESLPGIGPVTADALRRAAER